jgi:hypothetical protein
MAIKDCLVVGSCLLATAEYVCPVTIPDEVGVEFLAGRTMPKCLQYRQNMIEKYTTMNSRFSLGSEFEQLVSELLDFHWPAAIHNC